MSINKIRKVTINIDDDTFEKINHLGLNLSKFVRKRVKEYYMKIKEENQK